MGYLLSCGQSGLARASKALRECPLLLHRMERGTRLLLHSALLGLPPFLELLLLRVENRFLNLSPGAPITLSLFDLGAADEAPFVLDAAQVQVVVFLAPARLVVYAQLTTCIVLPVE